LIFNFRKVASNLFLTQLTPLTLSNPENIFGPILLFFSEFHNNPIIKKDQMMLRPSKLNSQAMYGFPESKIL